MSLPLSRNLLARNSVARARALQDPKPRAQTFQSRNQTAAHPACRRTGPSNAKANESVLTCEFRTGLQFHPNGNRRVPYAANPDDFFQAVYRFPEVNRGAHNLHPARWKSARRKSAKRDKGQADARA